MKIELKSSIRLFAMILFSPTRLLIDYLKQRHLDPFKRAEILLRWNHFFFWGELVITASLFIISCANPSFQLPAVLSYLLLALGAWRCNEIVYAFLLDANRELELYEPTTALKPGQRIKMAMRSYIGLLVNFSFVYYCMPKRFFCPDIKNFVEAFYFSGATLTTLGYGDIRPINPLSQLLTIYEVLSGLLLIVVSLAVYFSARGQKPA